MKRRIGISLAIIALVAGLAVTYPHLHSPTAPQSPQPDDSQTERVPQWQTDRHRVAALGHLTPEGNVIDIGAPSSERLGRLLVWEGQSVNAGDALAYLESHAERLAEAAYAESQLRDAEANFSAETSYAQASIAEAALRLKQLRQVPLLDIRAQEAQVRRLEADVAGAMVDLERFEGLSQKGTIAQQEVDHQRLQVHRLQEDLNRTSAILAKRKTEYETNLRLAQASLQTARANLIRAQAKVQLSTLKKNLELAQTRLARAVLRAPVDGQILQLTTYPGETFGQQPLLKMANTQQMYAIAEVYETDIGLVQTGQSATVSSPALPRPLTGRVIHIGRTIGKNDILSVDPAAATDTRVVEVKIRLDQSESAASLINLQVDIVIDLINRNQQAMAKP